MSQRSHGSEDGSEEPPVQVEETNGERPEIALMEMLAESSNRGNSLSRTESSRRRGKGSEDKEGSEQQTKTSRITEESEEEQIDAFDVNAEKGKDEDEQSRTPSRARSCCRRFMAHRWRFVRWILVFLPAMTATVWLILDYPEAKKGKGHFPPHFAENIPTWKLTLFIAVLAISYDAGSLFLALVYKFVQDRLVLHHQSSTSSRVLYYLMAIRRRLLALSVLGIILPTYIALFKWHHGLDPKRSAFKVINYIHDILMAVLYVVVALIVSKIIIKFVSTKFNSAKVLARIQESLFKEKVFAGGRV